ncbi:ligase-associated DNA damage response DEXH box helicase [Massilia forsythiae]|uniref:Ligase-associated DNA damage response DEXH box helicase n=1 Tax=Massilia forsythiae TaxID=2728020 RepID=A0A7Z2VXU8_9BURK|nr:ligase-associated DNA damage response DEXH box helicase [Massilia forsythiae]QJE01124.1 ligase-associated DNA damage response DEXH box helicase [Massilia forsythiae]
MTRSQAEQAVDAWFAARGWKVFPFQRAVWKAALAGHSGLLHANTGAGKTYAVWFAALLRGAMNAKAAGKGADKRIDAGTGKRAAKAAATGGAAADTARLAAGNGGAAARPKRRAAGVRVLWITPMRALAADTQRSLEAAAHDLGAASPDVIGAWSVGARTGDTTSAERARQARGLPGALITTPESLSLLLSHAGAREQFKQLDMVIVDEWHELMGSKRGVQLQLALARLRRWNPALVVWGLSATMGNLDDARRVLLGAADGAGAAPGVLVEGDLKKEIVVDTLVPANVARFPWAGQLGLQMLQPVIDEIERHEATLLFTNTRAQCEIWYQNLIEARPDWAGVVALHHGSLDRSVRDWVESGLKRGELKAVVCTASLDLGVDFLPVERVLQIGSAKGIARLLQRAGRSGHAPGRVSRVTLVPTHSLELLEAAAVKRAVASRRIEARQVPNKPFDVLVQHMVTVALGGGFDAKELYEEVKTAWSYRHLTAEEWQWALDFIARGGQSLTIYPEYRRVLPDEEGVYRVPDAAIGRRHRMSIGTIVSDAQMRVEYQSGGRIGTVEESFIGRMKPGDHFLFSGRILELVRVHEMTAFVKRSSSTKGAISRWGGTKAPLTEELAQAAREELKLAAAGRLEGPEMRALQPLLEVQQTWSALPSSDTLVVESMKSREGWHLFAYPIAGRSVHTGLASLVALRVSRLQPITFSIAVNDYGFELLSPDPVDWAAVFAGETGADAGVLATERLLEDVLASLNATQLSQQRFREVARIAGLVFQGYPGQHKSTRQVQASSSLFFEVFRKHDSANLLLTQAEREVLEQELELGRLRHTLVELHGRRIAYRDVKRATPFAFPLMVARFREKISSEKLSDRVARMVRELEKAAEA